QQLESLARLALADETSPASRDGIESMEISLRRWSRIPVRRDRRRPRAGQPRQTASGTAGSIARALAGLGANDTRDSGRCPGLAGVWRKRYAARNVLIGRNNSCRELGAERHGESESRGHRSRLTKPCSPLPIAGTS